MNIMVFSPHPDDETLGAGGYLLKKKDEGNIIGWFNFTNVDIKYGFDEDRVDKRNTEIKNVKEKYGFDYFFNFNLQPSKLDTYGYHFLIVEVSKQIKFFKPDVVLIPFRYDSHSDHKVVHDTVLSCTKTFRYPFIKMVLVMEIISETNYSTYSFNPNYYVDISNYIEKKLEIMNIYKSEIQNPPFPRSDEKIRSLASYRGSSINTFYAEAFAVAKIIDI